MVRLVTTRRGPRSWLGLRPRHRRAPHLPWLVNFFADRGTHLAAMIAYYALLSFVPLLFLLLFPLPFRLPHQHACQRDSLLLAAGKFIRLSIEEVFDLEIGGCPSDVFDSHVV